jgi:hypothetical protein
LIQQNPEIGAGDDPIGFDLASYDQVLLEGALVQEAL